MAGVDYLESLKQYAAGGGKDIGEFLRQHTQPAQTTPGPTAPAAPVAAAPVAPAAVQPVVQPASPVAPPTPPPAPMVNPSVNVVRDAFQRQDATPTAGAVASFPRPGPAEARSPINSNNLYPPAADQGRILGTNGAGPTVVQPATPAMLSTRPAPPLATAPAPPVATPKPIIAPASPLIDSEGPAGAEDPYRFRLPSERKSGQDFITREPISATVPPPDRNLAANTAEDDSPPGAAPYSSGPLANPKPSPPSAPGSNRGAVAALPRRRNQRRMEVAPTKLFAGSMAA